MVEDGSFWFQHRNQIIATLLELFPFEGTLLDVGGGNGFQVKALQDKGYLATLVEPIFISCRQATLRGVSNVVCSTLRDLQLKPHSVSAMSFFDVLEHLDHPELLLSEARRVLKENGKIYITVPAFQSLWSGEDIGAEHRRRYNIRGLTELLQESGFQVLYQTYFFQALFVPLFLSRTVPYLLGNRKRGSAQDHRPSPSSKVLSWILSREIPKVRQLRRLPWGTSLCCVASPA